jgi:hypothetical protein
MAALARRRAGLGRVGRRYVVLAGTVMLSLLLSLCLSAAAFAAEGQTDIPTSAGKEAPVLDYHLDPLTFIISMGLVVVFYVIIFWRSEKEFKKIIDVHFGPKEQ